MATPVEWLNEFKVNIGAADNEATSQPQIIGLSNGNILVAWVEAGITGVGTNPGNDIVGKIFDAEGSVVRDSYRLNNSSLEDNEDDFDIAATNDGGFILVFREPENATQSELHWERHNAAGDQIDALQFALENVAADNLSNPQIAVNLNDNSSYVTFTDDVGAGPDEIRGVRIDSNGVIVTAEFDAAQNSADRSSQGDSAILTNGNLVTVYEETDGANQGIEFKITTTAGVNVNTVNVTSGVTGNEAEVTSLLNGGFVVTWNQGNDILYRVYAGTGTAVTAVLTAASGADSQNEAEVVALPDGGFVIVWDNDTDSTLEARAYFANGNADGAVFIVENVATTGPDVGVTGDGRILFAWDVEANNDIMASIWDPRGNPINTVDYDNTPLNFVNTDVVTSRIIGTTVNGDGDDDTILGQGGNDLLIGGSGEDTIRGGGGNDTIRGGFSTDELFGDGGNDRFEIFNGEFSDNIDGGGGTGDILDLDARNDFGANVDLRNGTYTLQGPANTITGVEIVLGTQLADTLRGVGGTTLNGNGGNDTFDFRSGDGLPDFNGGAGFDTADFTTFGGTDFFIDLAGGGYIFNSTSPGPFSGALTSTENYLGGGGDDYVIASNGANTIDGNGGLEDTVDYTAAGSGVTVTLGIAGGQATGGSGIDTIVDVEHLVGSNFGDTLNGDGAANDLTGGLGNDVLNGNGGNDELFGGFSQDILNGGAGNDRLNGGFGNDTMDGGTGVDTAIYSGFGGTVTVNLSTAGAQNTGAASGIDTLVSIENLIGADFNDRLTGTAGAAGNNTIQGGFGSDLVFGLGGNDTLIGNQGNDNIQGGAGNDTINGGLGRDIMRGGTGDDTYIFQDIAQTAVGGQRDRIDDFSFGGANGNDTVDLSAIDANTGVGGDQAFSFVGTALFTGTAGELRQFSAPGPREIIEGDVNGDGVADFQIELFQFSAGLIASDFVL